MVFLRLRVGYILCFVSLFLRNYFFSKVFCFHYTYHYFTGNFRRDNDESFVYNSCDNALGSSEPALGFIVSKVLRLTFSYAYMARANH